MGAGRPLVLLHGLLGSGAQLADSGPARTLAAQGHQVILPDLRGHGDSARPHDPACYPPDVLADDRLALIDHLGLDDYDLGGYPWAGGWSCGCWCAAHGRPARWSAAKGWMRSTRNPAARTGTGGC